MRDSMTLRLTLAIWLVLTGKAYADKPSLVGYWELDESSGRIAIDSSDNKNNGQLIGGVDWVPSIGRAGGAVNFDGRDNTARIQISAKSIVPARGTVMLWARLAEQQSKKARNGYGFLFAARGKPDRIQLFVNQYDMTLNMGLGDKFRRAEKIATLHSETWYHIALTWDGINYVVYVDGIQKANGTYTGLTVLDTTANIGNNASGADQAFHGIIDEAAIFDKPLTDSEILKVYRQGVSVFTAPPELQVFIDAPQTAESLLKEKQLQKATAFLEEKIAELEQKQNGDSNDIGLFRKQIVPQLYFQLAKTKESAGLPKKDIAAAYRVAVQSQIAEQQGNAILWLNENTDAEYYRDVIQFLIKHNIDYLKGVAAMAAKMIDEQKSMAAIKFIETNLAVYADWREKHSSDVPVVMEDRLPEIYFQLAKAKEAGGMSKKDIADAYSKTFYPSRSGHILKRTEALIWLLDNNCSSQYKEVISSLAQSCNAEDFSNNVVSNVCKHFELKNNWDRYEQFLDVLFAETKCPSYWTVFVESCLSNETSPWAKKYSDYIGGKPKLKFIRDCAVAEKLVTEGQFKKAAELYRGIITLCKPEEDKVSFEFKLCECLYKAEEYHQVVPVIENFIAGNKVTHRNLVKEAMLMKGCAHIKLNEINKAVDNFLTLTIEYPGTKEAIDTNYFLGYCYMLQGKFKNAKEAFNSLLKNYPASTYAEKARSHLARINIITEN